MTNAKVFIVEDEGLIARDIESRLKRAGYEVTGSAPSGEEALETIPRAGADVVLMDIRLQGAMDGIETAGEVRARHDLPVIFLTAHADQNTLDRAKITEPFGYMVKPLSEATLSTTIEMALYKHAMDSKLREREAWLATTLGGVADAVVVADLLGLIILFNGVAEQLTGWPAREAVGQPVMRVLRLKLGDLDAEDPTPLALVRGEPVEFAKGLQLVSRGGNDISIEGAAAPVRTDRGSIGVALTFRDVTQRDWRERQLRQAQRVEAATRLAAALSTDFAALVASVQSKAGLLMREIGDFSPARQVIGEIHQSASAAAAIVKHLENFASRQVAHPEIVSPNAVLRRITKLIESVAGSKVEIALRLDKDAGRVRADPSQLEQAVISLVLHAVSSMREGGHLLIETGVSRLRDRLGEYVMLAVADDGPGYTEEAIERVFEPVLTASPEAPSSGGLGLAIVHTVASEAGGYAHAISRPGEGCRIEMYLPRWQEIPASPGPAMTLIFVDSRDSVRAEVHNYFESRGYNLLEATDTDEAAALVELHEGAIDMVIATGSVDELSSSHPDMRFLRIEQLIAKESLFRRVEEILKGQPAIAG